MSCKNEYHAHTHMYIYLCTYKHIMKKRVKMGEFYLLMMLMCKAMQCLTVCCFSQLVHTSVYLASTAAYGM